MHPNLFSAVEPREDILEGTLSEAIFAASLDEVVAGSAPAVYGDPETFFVGTHPSAGLKTLLDEALGRVGGEKPDAPSVIRLETNLGGGSPIGVLETSTAPVDQFCGRDPSLSDLSSRLATNASPGPLPNDQLTRGSVIVTSSWLPIARPRRLTSSLTSARPFAFSTYSSSSGVNTRPFSRTSTRSSRAFLSSCMKSPFRVHADHG
jgi:hypothetical protein